MKKQSSLNPNMLHVIKCDDIPRSSYYWRCGAGHLITSFDKGKKCTNCYVNLDLTQEIELEEWKDDKWVKLEE